MKKKTIMAPRTDTGGGGRGFWRWGFSVERRGLAGGGRSAETFQAADSLAINKAAEQTLGLKTSSGGSALEKAVAGKRGLARRLAWQKAHTALSPQELLEQGGRDLDQVRDLLNQWARQDPAAAWWWMRERGADAFGNYLFSITGDVFREWARRDLPGALREFRRLDYEERGQAAEGMLPLLLEDDSALSARVAEHLDELTAASGGMVRTVMRDPANAAEKLALLPPSPGRTTLLKQAGEMWFNKDWQAAVRWAGNLPEEEAGPLLQACAARILRVDYGDAGGGKPVRAPLPGDDAQFTWAREWLETQAPPGQRARLGPGFVKRLAVSDPAAALAWAEHNLGGLTLAQAVAGVTQGLYVQEPAQARDLVENLPPGGVRQQAMNQLAKQWSKADAPAAVEWLLEHDEAKTPFFGWYEIAAEWSERDLSGLRAWVVERPDLPENLLGHVTARLWLKDGPAAFGEWTRSLPEGPLRQAAERRLEAAAGR